MASNDPNNKTPELDSDRKLLDGLEKNQASLAPFILAGTTYTPTDCMNTMQSRVNLGLAAVTAKAAAHVAVQASRDERAQTHAFVRDLKKELVLRYSNQPDTLAQYG